jgi:hypothetical protein
MLKKINIKVLLILFTALAAVVVIIYVYDHNRGDRTFRHELIAVDTASVTTIRIFPKGGKGSPVILERTGKHWEVNVDQKKYPADSSVIRNILATMLNVTAERVAASDAAGWNTFELSDSLGRRVLVEQGGNVVADFVVGKASFSQPQGMQNRRGGRGFDVKSHVRIAGDEKVYVVDGFMSIFLSDQPSHYRNKLICSLNPDMLTKLTFIYPGDSSFVLTRSITGWLINDKPADSAKTALYLSSIANSTSSDFADEGNAPVTFPYTLRIEGNNMQPVEISGAVDPVQKIYYIRSSANEQALFGSAGISLFNRIFTGKSKF